MEMNVITRPDIRLTRRVREMQISPTLAVMNRAIELTAQGIDVVDLEARREAARAPVRR